MFDIPLSDCPTRILCSSLLPFVLLSLSPVLSICLFLWRAHRHRTVYLPGFWPVKITRNFLIKFVVSSRSITCWVPVNEIASNKEDEEVSKRRMLAWSYLGPSYIGPKIMREKQKHKCWNYLQSFKSISSASSHQIDWLNNPQNHGGPLSQRNIQAAPWCRCKICL